MIRERQPDLLGRARGGPADRGGGGWESRQVPRQVLPHRHHAGQPGHPGHQAVARLAADCGETVVLLLIIDNVTPTFVSVVLRPDGGKYWNELILFGNHS